MAQNATAFEKSFKPAKRNEFLQYLREGMRRGAACDAVFGGDDPKRRMQMRDYIDGHPDFLKLVLDAEQDALEHVEEALYQAAVSGSVAAAKTWIELNGGGLVKRPVGRPSSDDKPPKNPPGEDGGSGDPFDDLDNVTPIRRGGSGG